MSHLLNIDDGLAATVADGLGLKAPAAARAGAGNTRTDLNPSDALSIIKRNIGSFEGRKLGLLMTDGADADLFAALTDAVEEEGGVYEVVAPKISGVNPFATNPQCRPSRK